MANFNDIKHEIDQNVNTNGVQAITGAILNETLKDMIDEVDEKKQDTLVAGQNITISGNVISATGGGSGETYTAGHGIDISVDNEISVDTEELAGYGLNNTDYTFNVDTSVIQGKLTAGANIQINGDTISATDTNTTYSAGSGLNLNGTTFSVDASSLAGSGLQDDGNGHLEVDPSVVQEKLTAGDGVEIDQNNEISVKAGSGLGFDANGYLINTGGGGGGTTYTAGDGIEIDSNNVISAKTGPGLLVDPTTNNIELDRSALNFLPLEGGILQDTTPANDTTLTVMDGMNEDYVRIVAPETQGAPHVEIFENGSGDTKFYYDRMERGTQTTINYPTQSGTLALTSDIPYAPVYSGGNAIDIDASTNAISVKYGSGLFLDGSNYLEVDYNSIPGNIAGNGLQDDGNGHLQVDTSTIQEKLVAGQNITISGNVISAAGGSGGNYLPLDGGVLQNTASGQTSTILNLVPPLGGPGGVIYQSSNDNGGYGNITIGSAGYNQAVIQNDFIQVSNATSGKSLEITSEGFSDGSVYHASLPTLTQDEILATQSDVNTAVSGKQDTLTAGSGISIVNNVISATGGGGSSYSAGNGINIDANNVISNTAPDPGLWVAGTGTNSIKSTSASTANGNNALAVGANAKANGNQSVALGQGASSSGVNSTAIGANASSSGASSTAIGNNVSAQNLGETALGKYNLPNSSSNNNEMTAFTIGNGANSSNKSNVLEIKANNDAYLSGVGGYTGTNASSADTLQDVINGKQDQLTAGSGISIQGNVISATGGGGSSYSAGNGIDITNNTISVDATDLDGAGLTTNQNGELEVDTNVIQGKLTAGSGISIQNNVISATGGGGSGLWTSGTGTGSVMSPGAFQANGNNSVSAGDYTRSNGTSSIALGTSTTTTGLSAAAIGADSTAAGSYSVALGHGLGAVNTDETALGKFNNYIDTGTTAEKTFFTIGNGTSNNTKSNIIEIKQNNDAFLVGIGGFDGTNASQALSLQTVINSKQNQLVSGVDIKTINGQSIVGGGDLVISGGSTLSAGDGIGIQNDTISVKYDSTRGIGYDNSVGHNELYVQLGSGLQFDGNGAIELSGGSGSSYTAGTGISIDSSNVITNTAPDPGLWIAGSGAGSIKSVNANTGSVGANSMSIGRKSRATGMNSIALGDFITTNGIASSGLGTNSVADGMNSTVIGNGASTLNTDEIGLGKFNNSINTGTTAEKTQFTVGNGTGTTARSNLIEAKQNNDIYVLGIGGFDGTNASQALTLQTVINSKQNQLVSGVDIKTINGQSIVGGGNLVISGGSSLWTSGTGQNSLVSPGAGASSQGSDADGVGAIVIGEDSNANGDYSFAHGQASMANGDYSAAFVSGNSTGDYSFAAGNGADAQAESSVAIGSGATTIFDNSDPDNPINADSSVAIGNGAQTYGLNSIAIGDSATAQGERSIALSGGEASGLGSIAGGNASHANGMYSTAFAGSTADANYSFAASDGQAYAHYSTALSGGEARGEGAFASGQGNGAYGYSAAALGYMAQTYSQANGALSTDPNAGEVALGRYNYSEQGIVFTVGCGYYDETDPDNPVDVRQNAVAIDSTGKIFLKGLGGYTGTSTSGCTDLVSFLSNQ